MNNKDYKSSPFLELQKIVLKKKDWIFHSVMIGFNDWVSEMRDENVEHFHFKFIFLY